MSRLLIVVALLGLPQDGQIGGLTIERKVRLISRDLVGKASEYQRREVVRIKGSLVAIEDVTFGTRIVIRTDKKLVWVIDSHAGTYSELAFDAIASRRAHILNDLADAKKRVPGTQDADDIDKVMIGLGSYPSTPTVEARDTGKSADVAGRTCSGREIVVNGTDHPVDVLIDPTLGEGVAYIDALAAIGGFHPAIAEKLRSIGGFPLQGKMRYALFLDRIVADEVTTSVVRGEIASAEFELPEKLKLTPLKGFDPDAGPKPEKPKDFTPSYKEDDIDRERDPLKKPPEEKKEPPK